MQKIVPHLWFDKEAKEAAKFYTSIFDNSKIKSIKEIHNTPSGDVDIVSFEILGYEFNAISAGPYFKFNPSISFHVKCKTTKEVDAIWEKLSKDGKVLMPLDKYPFSDRYGWIQDKFGVSWQIIFTKGEFKQGITPVLMFTNKVCGKTEEALELYSKIFPNSKYQILSRYSKGEEPDKAGTVRYAHFFLEGQEFGAMDSAREHAFNFNEAISLIVNCKDQKEIDHYWKLSSVPQAEQCGWLKDKFGVSWQIVPIELNKLMSSGDKNKTAKVTEAFLEMKKFDISKLRAAFEKG